ncbi:MAG: amino acid adenylation domain-containing protein, partial [Desulfobacteraceae bacterium]|nr:amino acid adenylation domain-containing protein [Desulfobacteraceae bacterium]
KKSEKPQSGSVSVEFDTNISHGIREFVKKTGVNAATLLFSGFSILLHHESRRDDILVGMPTSTLASLPHDIVDHNVAGYIINPVVIRSVLKKNVKTYLDDMDERISCALDHQAYPFYKIQEKYRFSNQYPGSGIFNVSFNYMAFEGTNKLDSLVVPVKKDTLIAYDNLKLCPFPIPQQEGVFHLSMAVIRLGESFFVTLTYDGALFDRDSILRKLTAFQEFVTGIIRQPESAIPDLIENSGIGGPAGNQIDADEIQRLYELSLPAKSLITENRLIPELFRERAIASPNATAIICENGTMTYNALDDNSDQVARLLYARGAGPGTMVGVCMGRSMETVAVLLGIFKSGAVYVPIDPGFPKSRISYIIEDSGLGIMVSQYAFVEKGLFKGHDLDIIVLKTEMEKDTGSLSLIPEKEVPSDPAYVIYTSGSTGKPKGILISKQDIAKHCLNAANTYGINGKDRVLQFASFSFDVSLEQVFATLLSGAVLVLRQDSLWTYHECLQYIETHQISVANFPPAYLKELLTAYNEADVEKPWPLRLVISGGDVMNADIAQLWRKICPFTRLLNAYGPTETTITALVYEIPQIFAVSEKAPVEIVPIGRPLAGRTVHVLDENLELVTLGTPGELIIGGDGVGFGYLNRPELTKHHFIKSLFPEQISGVMYRTGDIVRMGDDGQIEFLGRKDHQIKIRGFRIEPEEIEACLISHPDVKEAAVILDTINGENKTLTAFVVFNGETVDLSGYLKGSLPDYMLPNTVTALDMLPRMPASGKVDKQALKLLAAQISEKEYDLPRDQVEDVLLSVWSNVLKHRRIGINNNFFELGGHSLLAAGIVTRARQIFNVDIAFSDLFEAPTVSGFAKRIKSALEGTVPVNQIIRIDPGGSQTLSFGQKRLWFMSILEENSVVYNMFFAFQLKGSLDHACFEKSLNEIIRRHQSFRTCFLSDEGTPVCKVEKEVILKVPVNEIIESAIQDRLYEESSIPFDISKAPLLRARLFKVVDEPGPKSCHICFFNMHHIISDGWSIDLFLKEFSRLYHAFVHERPSPLPTLSIQYADFAKWQQTYLTGELFDKQLAYWKMTLKGAPHLLELPCDKPRPRLTEFKGDMIYFDMDKSVFSRIHDLTIQTGITHFIFLQTVFSILLSKTAHQDDIVTGFPVAGRNHPQTRDLVGFFVNTLVLRVCFKGCQKKTFLDLARVVRKQLVEAMTHQDIPFERLVEKLNIPRNPSCHPLVQVSFSMIENETDSLKLPGVSVKSFQLERKVSRYDLSLYILENEDSFSGAFEYNTDLFLEDTISRMAEIFKYLVDRVLENPDITYSELGLNNRQSGIKTGAASVKLSGNPEIKTLKQYLGEKLPDFMVPSHIIPVEKFPLNSSGKTGLKALAAIEPTLGVNKEEPQNEIEARILSIWENVLPRQKIGTEDNFFNIGGNSLLLLKVHSALNKAYPGRLTVADLFIRDSVQKIARALAPEFRLDEIVLPVFPREVFTKDEAVKEFEFDLEGPAFNALKKKTRESGLSSRQIVTAAFAFLLFQKSQKEKFQFFAIFSRKKIAVCHVEAKENNAEA